MNKKENAVLIILVVLLLTAVIAYLLISKGIIKNPLQKQKSNLGEQIYKEVQNPISGKIPETNPFSKVNPFKGVYKNPFQ